MSDLEQWPANKVYEYMKDNPAKLLDVRTADEYKEVHAQNTVHLALQSLNPSTAENASLEKEEKIFVICRSGKRSADAIQKLKEMGYTDLINVEGGTMAWQAAGLPVSNS